MKKHVLMVAYHYPPLSGSSGLQRTLKFSQYLPRFGWEPLVLTAHPRAYQNTGVDQLGEIPEGIVVRRAFALDTARHLSIRGIYPRLLALPDRWVSWWFGAVVSGLRLIYKYRPAIIWSTYPIATAHLIGLTLHKITGIPWVADFRDPMTDIDYPSDPAAKHIYHWIERKALAYCSKAVFTTPGAIKIYKDRFPELPVDRFQLIPNGYDEENFIAAEQAVPKRRASAEQLVLVHSGTLYPSERDPRPFFGALSDLLKRGDISSQHLKIILRATGHDDYIRQLIAAYEISTIVVVEPPIPYEAALSEMLTADGLLIFQASNCNHQIPAKIYEYLRARRPILALTDPSGDTAEMLRDADIDTIAPLDAKEAIMEQLLHFMHLVRSGSAPIARDDKIAAYSRLSHSLELVKLFDCLPRA